MMSMGGTAERFAANLEQLRQLSGEQLIKRIDFRGLFQFPAVVYIEVGLQSLDSPSWTTVNVPASDGSQGPVDLRWRATTRVRLASAPPGLRQAPSWLASDARANLQRGCAPDHRGSRTDP